MLLLVTFFPGVFLAGRPVEQHLPDVCSGELLMSGLALRLTMFILPLVKSSGVLLLCCTLTKALRRGHLDRARGICPAKQANHHCKLIHLPIHDQLLPLQAFALSIFICQD